ncbi:MAG: SagB/ThcOx family dehydrogenase [Bacteroidales bacterium]|jgi:SagB-type dehydrogenase family enzyme|nr:SagB/ThcOx family dehydrogenase [Bacteroidales bacterium]
MNTFRLILVFLFIALIQPGNAQEIMKLPEPDKTGGMPLMQAINERHSARNFADRDLSEQQLSELLWAAYGINRPESGKHTIPTSRNRQDIEVYLTTSEGVFKYLPEQHALLVMDNRDQREVSGLQDFVKVAAVNLIYVSDFDKLGNSSDDIKTMTAATHCGFIGQNVYLYCASEGLISVFRAMVDKEKAATMLQLEGNKKVIYSQSVGFSK